MKKDLRPIPYPIGSKARQQIIDDLLRYSRHSRKEIIAYITDANRRARERPRPGEKCGARTRKGAACQCKALSNGRCKFHGGLSTGPKTADGKVTVTKNLRRKGEQVSGTFPTSVRARGMGLATD